MTKVTNIYIDTTGFTDEQYAAADSAMDGLKSSDIIGWPVGDIHPDTKAYPILCIDCAGDRQYQNNVDEFDEDDDAKYCQPVLLSDLVEMKLRANYEESLKLKKFRIIVDGKPADDNLQPITVIDRMTPEKERDIVCAVSSSLYSARLISTDAYRVIINSMADYAEANDTQP